MSDMGDPKNDAELIESAARKVAVLGHMPLREARQHAAKALVEMRREQRLANRRAGS